MTQYTYENFKNRPEVFSKLFGLSVNEFNLEFDAFKEIWEKNNDFLYKLKPKEIFLMYLLYNRTDKFPIKAVKIFFDVSQSTVGRIINNIKLIYKKTFIPPKSELLTILDVSNCFLELKQELENIGEASLEKLREKYVLHLQETLSLLETEKNLLEKEIEKLNISILEKKQEITEIFFEIRRVQNTEKGKRIPVYWDSRRKTVQLMPEIKRILTEENRLMSSDEIFQIIQTYGPYDNLKTKISRALHTMKHKKTLIQMPDKTWKMNEEYLKN